MLDVPETVQFVTTVQVHDGICNIGDNHQRGVSAGNGGNLDGALRLDGIPVTDGLVLDIPTFVLIVNHVGKRRLEVVVGEEAAVYFLGAIVSFTNQIGVIENHHIEVVAAGFVNSRSLGLGAHRYLVEVGRTKGNIHGHRFAFGDTCLLIDRHILLNQIPAAGENHQQKYQEVYSMYDSLHHGLIKGYGLCMFLPLGNYEVEGNLDALAYAGLHGEVLVAADFQDVLRTPVGPGQVVVWICAL